MAVHGGRRFSFVVKASSSERYARRKMLRESMDVVTKNIMPMLRGLRVEDAAQDDESVKSWNNRVERVVARAAERLRGLVLEVADSLEPFGDISATEEDEEEEEEDEEEVPRAREKEEGEEDEYDDAYGGEGAGVYGEEAGTAEDGEEVDQDADDESDPLLEDDDYLDALSEEKEESVLWGLSDAARRAVRDRFESSQYGMFNGYGRRPGEHQEWMSRVMNVAGESLADLMDAADP